jgi:hypothetical protein
VREVLEQDVHGVGCAVRALELLAREDGLVGFDELVEGVADHDTEVLQAHLVDALVHGRDELSGTTLPPRISSGSAGTIKEIGRPFQTFSRLAPAWRSRSSRTCTYWSHSGTRKARWLIS